MKLEKLEDLKFLKVAIEKHPTTGIQLEYLDKPNAIAALLLNAVGDKVLLVKQYRPGFQGYMYEIPAGIMEDGEDPVYTLEREIEEETGYLKNDYNIIYSPKKPLILSPGYTSESLYIYIIQLKDDSIMPQNLKLDIGEDLIDTWFPLSEIEELQVILKLYLLFIFIKILKILKSKKRV